jgi:hypothetical protein
MKYFAAAVLFFALLAGSASAEVLNVDQGGHGIWLGGSSVVSPEGSAGSVGAPNVRSWLLVGHNATTTATLSTVWNHIAKGNAVATPIASTSTLQLVSSIPLVAATPQVIRVTGLDANWALQTEDLTFNASSSASPAQASLKTWRRVFGAKNVGPTTDIGTTYIFTTGTVTSDVPNYKLGVQAVVTAAEGTSFNALWTCPAGSRAVIKFCHVPTTVTEWEIRVRPYGGSWRTVMESTTTGRVDFDGMISLEARMDVMVLSAASNADVYCYLGIMEYK